MRWLIFGAGLLSGTPVLCIVAGAETDSRSSANPSPSQLNWNTGANQSFLVPAVEIPGFLVALNVFNRNVLDSDEYGTTASGTWRHVRHGPWGYDDDTFNVNQFGHPAMGAIMYGSARSAGLNFWQALVYSNVGSLMWELGGETGHPSSNDIITTSQAGSLLGESLFRMASLVLEHGGKRPSLQRELLAAMI